VEFRSVQALRGPNIWARFPVLEAWVDLGDLNDTSSDSVPGFNDRLKSWLPSLVEHRCSVGERGGFFVRLERGTYLAHILEHVTLELQSLAGTPVGFGRARASNEDRVYKVAVQYREEELGRACLEAARELCLAAVFDRPYDVQATIQRLRDLAHNVCLGPSTASIVRAAAARGIPARRLNKYSLVQLGYGAKQKRILASETANTPAIAESIAQDKELTKELLRTIGVPVPWGRVANDAEDAWAAAQEIGLPVVIKPQYGNQGRGVATNLQTREQVVTAFNAASEQGSYIIVEKYAPGDDYRLLVVGNKLVAAAKREPAHVIGDGVSTIEQLVEVVNRDPRRSDGHATSLSKIPLDSVSLAVLDSQGYTPQSVPRAGERVLIRRNANLSTGGTAADVTDEVHPEVAARAVEAARMVGLDVAGVDVVAQDISRPLEEQGGVIVEVNAGPGLRMHLEPSSGQGRPVGEAIVESLFPQGESGRIPIVGVTGTNGKTTTTRLIAHMLATHGLKVGMTSTDGIYIDGRRIDAGDCSGPTSAGMVLENPLVEAAVLETARGGILRAGLAFDRCDVAVMTNIGEGDHLGKWDIDTPERMAWVKRTLTDNVAKTGYGVFKADDPLVADMAPHCPGQVIFFAQDEKHPVMAAHRAEGKRVIFVRDGQVIAAQGSQETFIADLENVPLTQQGRIGFQIENVLASSAAAWALEVPVDAIRRALRTFTPDMGTSPGRFNLLEIGGSVVILDYGHNTSALLALVEAIQQFPHERRTVVYSAAGDRRDSDMIQQGQILGDTFDRVILYEDHYLRGRREGEIMALFRKGLAEGSRVAEIQEIRGGVKAVEVALHQAGPGQLILIQPDKIDETLDYVRQYVAHRAAGNEIDLNSALATAQPAEALAGEVID
jgi:cyanophycin synthetase